jgi:hypothetical protein
MERYLHRQGDRVERAIDKVTVRFRRRSRFERATDAAKRGVRAAAQRGRRAVARS